jgi:hypothetical protein
MNAPAADTLPLSVTILRFTLRALDPVRFPALPASTLRGALGNTLRTLTCQTGAATCDGCPHFNRCSFAQDWLADSPEKIAPQSARPTGVDTSRGAAHAPPPYIVACPPYTGHPTYLEPGDLFGFRLHLFGHTATRPEIWEAAVRAAALTGFAEGRGRLTTQASIDPTFRPTADDGPWLAPVRLRFVTPLHIRRDRHRLDYFDPVAFTLRLTDRVHHLIDLYGTGPSPLAPDDLAEMASAVRITHHDIHPITDHRISDRQGRTIPINGFVGTATVTDVPRPLRSLWALAEHFHAGKGAPMGLGQVRVDALG